MIEDDWKEPRREKAEQKVPDPEQLRRFAARRYYREAPAYRVAFEDNGSVTLRRKRYEYWPDKEPEDATTWELLSTHGDLEEAERRLRLICSGSIFDDGEGRPTKPPRSLKPKWPTAPTDGEEDQEG